MGGKYSRRQGGRGWRDFRGLTGRINLPSLLPGLLYDPHQMQVLEPCINDSLRTSEVNKYSLQASPLHLLAPALCM